MGGESGAKAGRAEVGGGVRPRIIGVLSWYEESPSWLAALVASCAGLVDHLVAVDGAYALTPGSLRRPRSGREQADVIYATATELGMGCSIHAPAQAFLGGEVEKRTFAFRAANLVAEPGIDWLLVLDGDEVVSEKPLDIAHRLGETQHDVATCTLWQRHVEQPLPGENGITYPEEMYGGDAFFRKLFRADPTLRVEGAHYVYAIGPTDAPRYLWGHELLHEIEEAEDLHELKIEHRNQWRSGARQKLQRSYYALRDQVGVEALA